jgi:DNA-binding HxlR family transcriptional regulator
MTNAKTAEPRVADARPEPGEVEPPHLPDLETPRPSAVRHALEIVSDPWTYAILQEAFFGVRRFEQLRAQLGISRGILSKRLASLVENGILERVRYQRRPDRFEYPLTERGRALYPVFIALQRWGEDWLEDAGDATRLTLIHEACGQRSRPRLTCDRCGEPIRAEEMTYER